MKTPRPGGFQQVFGNIKIPKGFLSGMVKKQMKSRSFFVFSCTSESCVTDLEDFTDSAHFMSPKICQKRIYQGENHSRRFPKLLFFVKYQESPDLGDLVLRSLQVDQLD